MFKCKCKIMALGAILVMSFAGVANAAVNLEWRPSQQSVTVGDSVYMDLYAVSDTANGNLISSINAVIQWDPTTLDFYGIVGDESQPYWMTDGFMRDLGGLNNDPYYDGDAVYSAFANLGVPTAVGSNGLLCASFKWVALAPTADSVVSIISGKNGSTSIVVDGAQVNHNITGTLGSGHVSVADVPEPSSLLALATGVMRLAAIRRRRS